MNIREGIKLSLLNNNNVLNDILFKNLMENCCLVLSGKPEVHNFNSLCGSKPNLVKEFFAALLSAIAEFVRTDSEIEEISDFLLKDCSFSLPKTKIFVDLYSLNKQNIQITLLNIGNQLPHVTDINWKIDYIVKSSVSDESEGPLLRISLSTEVYDIENRKKKMEYVNFTCNSQELQDLVYKLKDAVRHCQHIASEH